MMEDWIAIAVVVAACRTWREWVLGVVIASAAIILLRYATGLLAPTMWMSAPLAIGAYTAAGFAIKRYILAHRARKAADTPRFDRPTLQTKPKRPDKIPKIMTEIIKAPRYLTMYFGFRQPEPPISPLTLPPRSKLGWTTIASANRQELLVTLAPFSEFQLREMCNNLHSSYVRYGKSMREDEFASALRDHLDFVIWTSKHRQQYETLIFRRRILALGIVLVALAAFRYV